jgi:deoxyribose-phosphate aldolase
MLSTAIKEVEKEIGNTIARSVAASSGRPVKVILETCMLDERLKIAGCLLARAAGAALVKTSTGFSTGGATADDLRLLKRAEGATMGVKASGGVRTLVDLRRMVAAGASRIGTSSSLKIAEEANR